MSRTRSWTPFGRLIAVAALAVSPFTLALAGGDEPGWSAAEVAPTADAAPSAVAPIEAAAFAGDSASAAAPDDPAPHDPALTTPDDAALEGDAGEAATEPPEYDGLACDEGGPTIRVTVENVKAADGVIVADLHDDKVENFLKPGRHVARVRATAEKGSTSFCLPAPATGVFAIGVYHDENANREFDKGALGLPAEPYGVSRNPKMRFGPPKFKKARFDVAEDGADIVIKLKN